jgi:hypothetical protein
MSLEQAITDHAAALRELAAAIRATAGAAHESTAAAADKVITEAKASAATKQQATVVTKPAGEVKAAAASTTNAGADAPAPTYDDVKAKVLELSKDKGRDQVVALLQRHGVAKAPDLKPEQYAAVIADVDAILAGTLDVIAGEAA